MIFTILWIYLLNYICQFKYGKKIAWFIVLLPFFFMGLMLIGLMCAVSFIALQSTKNKELQKKIDSKSLDSNIKEPKMMEPLAKRQTQQPQQREQLSELLRQ